MADLSVEHAATVGHFRAAQQITSAAASGEAATEDLRQALIHYRALFADLLGVGTPAEPPRRPTAHSQHRRAPDRHQRRGVAETHREQTPPKSQRR